MYAAICDFNENQEWELQSVIFKNDENSYDREIRYMMMDSI